MSIKAFFAAILGLLFLMPSAVPAAAQPPLDARILQLAQADPKAEEDEESDPKSRRPGRGDSKRKDSDRVDAKKDAAKAAKDAADKSKDAATKEAEKRREERAREEADKAKQETVKKQRDQREAAEKATREAEARARAEKSRAEDEAKAKQEAAKKQREREAAEKTAREAEAKTRAAKSRADDAEKAKQETAKKQRDREAEKTAREAEAKARTEKSRAEEVEEAKQEAAKKQRDREAAEKSAREAEAKTRAEKSRAEDADKVKQEALKKQRDERDREAAEKSAREAEAKARAEKEKAEPDEKAAQERTRQTSPRQQTEDRDRDRRRDRTRRGDDDKRGPELVREREKEKTSAQELSRTEVRSDRPTEIDGGSRTLRREGDRVVIRSNDLDRLRHSRDRRGDQRVERLPDGQTRTIVIYPDGTQIITVTGRRGEIVYRSRRERGGREIVLIREVRRPPVAQINLGPLRIAIPREQYIVDSRRASRRDMYAALVAPPVERVERVYSLEEVRRFDRVRDKMRRIDITSITFDTDSALITPDQAGALEELADIILDLIDRNPEELFLLEGHTDLVGSDIYNLALSERRAEAVAIALTDYFDVPAENLVTQGYGEAYPKIPTELAERENRRVAVRRITPLVAGK